MKKSVHILPRAIPKTDESSISISIKTGKLLQLSNQMLRETWKQVVQYVSCFRTCKSNFINWPCSEALKPGSLSVPIIKWWHHYTSYSEQHMLRLQVPNARLYSWQMLPGLAPKHVLYEHTRSRQSLSCSKQRGSSNIPHRGLIQQKVS